MVGKKSLYPYDLYPQLYFYNINIYNIYIYISAWFAVGGKANFLRAAKVLWSHRNIRLELFALFLLNRPADTPSSLSALFSAPLGGEEPLLPGPVHFHTEN